MNSDVKVDPSDQGLQVASPTQANVVPSNLTAARNTWIEENDSSSYAATGDSTTNIGSPYDKSGYSLEEGKQLFKKLSAFLDGESLDEFPLEFMKKQQTLKRYYEWILKTLMVYHHDWLTGYFEEYGTLDTINPHDLLLCLTPLRFERADEAKLKEICDDFQLTTALTAALGSQWGCRDDYPEISSNASAIPISDARVSKSVIFVCRVAFLTRNLAVNMDRKLHSDVHNMLRRIEEATKKVANKKRERENDEPTKRSKQKPAADLTKQKQWYERFDRVKAFVEENNGKLPTQKEDKQLSRWVQYQQDTYKKKPDMECWNWKIPLLKETLPQIDFRKKAVETTLKSATTNKTSGENLYIPGCVRTGYSSPSRSSTAARPTDRLEQGRFFHHASATTGKVPVGRDLNHDRPQKVGPIPGSGELDPILDGAPMLYNERKRAATKKTGGMAPDLRGRARSATSDDKCEIIEDRASQRSPHVTRPVSRNDDNSTIASAEAEGEHETPMAKSSVARKTQFSRPVARKTANQTIYNSDRAAIHPSFVQAPQFQDFPPPPRDDAQRDLQPENDKLNESERSELIRLRQEVELLRLRRENEQLRREKEELKNEQLEAQVRQLQQTNQQLEAQVRPLQQTVQHLEAQVRQLEQMVQARPPE